MRWPTLLPVALVVVSACGAPKEAPVDSSIEKALSHVVEGQEKMKASQDNEAVAKMKAKAAQESATAHQAEFDALITVPADGGAGLAEDCAAAAAAYDTFRTARLSGDALARWNAIKALDLGKIAENCTQAKNKEVAACKAHALATVPVNFAEAEADQILAACEDRFGAGK